MKVTLFVHDLASNPIVRAAPIAHAIREMGYEVEVLGLTFNSDKIYPPYKDEFDYKTLRTYLDIRWVIKNAFKLARMAEGDIIYAFKPLWSSFFPALLASGFGFRKKLLLDIEDNEFWEPGKGVLKELKKRIYYPKRRLYIYLLHPFTLFARKKTVACRSLRRRYGGKILLHGPNENIHDPNILPTRQELLKKYKLPAAKRYVGFAGRPVFYNGLDKIIEGLKAPALQHWDLILVGNTESDDFQQAKTILKDRCHLIGTLVHDQMPEILKVIDVIPVLQDKNPATKMQIPAKLLEAMAMQKIIIATEVCDIPEILNGRGFIIPVNNSVGSFVTCLENIDPGSEIAQNMGEKAREYYLNNSSTGAMKKILREQMELNIY